MKLTSRKLRSIIKEEVHNILEDIDFGFLKGVSKKLEAESSSILTATFTPTRRDNSNLGVVKITTEEGKYELFLERVSRGSIEVHVTDMSSRKVIGTFSTSENTSEIVKKVLDIL